MMKECGPFKLWVVFKLCSTALVFCFSLSVVSCAKSEGELNEASLVTECDLPDDQSGTVNGTWPSTPIPVALHAGSGFSETERSAITSGFETWNNFFNQSKGQAVINLRGETSQNKLPNQQICQTGIVSSGGFGEGSVAVYKQTNWPYGGDVVAVTFLCHTPGGQFNQLFHNAAMELNYKNFFATGKRPDLQSIMTHEFGHLLGLNHSCEVGGGDGTPDCNAADTIITDAIMFPRVLFGPNGVGEVRRDLNSNDQSRANCLY